MLLAFFRDVSVPLASEAFGAKEEERKKAEEEKNQKEALSKGTNTPSGRPKHTDALKNTCKADGEIGRDGG
jgi:transcription initiation factor TFIIF subunit alpha